MLLKQLIVHRRYWYRSSDKTLARTPANFWRLAVGKRFKTKKNADEWTATCNTHRACKYYLYRVIRGTYLLESSLDAFCGACTFITAEFVIVNWFLCYMLCHLAAGEGHFQCLGWWGHWLLKNKKFVSVVFVIVGHIQRDCGVHYHRVVLFEATRTQHTTSFQIT